MDGDFLNQTRVATIQPDDEIQVKVRSGYWGHQYPRSVVMSGAQFEAAIKVASKDAGIAYAD